MVIHLNKTFEYNKKIIVVDLEASGCNYDKHSIIQIGAVRLSKTLEIEDEFNKYIIPYKEEWNKEAEQIHHITQIYLAENGMFLNIVLKNFVEWIGEPKEYYIAQWSCGWDFNMILKAFQHLGWDNPFPYRNIDIASIVRFNLFTKGFSPGKSLYKCANILGIDTKKYKPHDGLDDARLTVEVLQKVRDEQTHYFANKNR